MSATGRVARVFRWPGKGFGGEELAVAELDRRGLVGDRRGYLTGANGRKVTAFGVPRLLRWGARWEDGAILVRDPDGRARPWSDPELPTALSEDLGRPVTLHDAPDGAPDVARTVHITVEASRQEVERAINEKKGTVPFFSLDVRRFRPNLHLDLDDAPFAEETWTGRRLTIGATELEVVEPCDRCVVVTRDPDTVEKRSAVLLWLTRERNAYFGIRARVVAPGHVRPDDPVSGSG